MGMSDKEERRVITTALVDLIKIVVLSVNGNGEANSG